MKKSRQNKGFKTQIMLPFQGENGLGRFLTQGDAIGLIYAAQGDAIGLRYAAPSGRRRLGVFPPWKGNITQPNGNALGKIID